jgi:hypothetical protein
MTVETTGTLTGVVTDVQPGAGQRYAVLLVTNVGEATVLEGYSSLLLLDASMQPLPTNAQWDLTPGPAPISLPHDAPAAANLRWSVIAGTGEPTQGPCEPTPAFLQVTPQSGAGPFVVTWSNGPVCQQGTIRISAYYVPTN